MLDKIAAIVYDNTGDEEWKKLLNRVFCMISTENS